MIRIELPAGFENRVFNAAEQFNAEATMAVAGQASANVHTVLNARIQHPTPYYETQITVERQGNDVVVHDRGVVYGPWLEGVSARNQSTRFKGYHAFRIGEQQVQAQVPALTAPIASKHLGNL